MNIKLGIVMDPIESIKPYKDSSLAMLLAAQERGWELHYFLQENLLIDNGIAQGYGQPLTVTDSEENWFTLSDPTLIPLGDLDVILMRKDPPFDSQFLYLINRKFYSLFFCLRLEYSLNVRPSWNRVERH